MLRKLSIKRSFPSKGGITFITDSRLQNSPRGDDAWNFNERFVQPLAQRSGCETVKGLIAGISAGKAILHIDVKEVKAGEEYADRNGEVAGKYTQDGLATDRTTAFVELSAAGKAAASTKDSQESLQDKVAFQLASVMAAQFGITALPHTQPQTQTQTEPEKIYSEE